MRFPHDQLDRAANLITLVTFVAMYAVVLLWLLRPEPSSQVFIEAPSKSVVITLGAKQVEITRQEIEKRAK